MSQHVIPGAFLLAVAGGALGIVESHVASVHAVVEAERGRGERVAHAGVDVVVVPVIIALFQRADVELFSHLLAWAINHLTIWPPR